MPVLPTRRQQPNPVTPQVPIPSEFPAIPPEVLERFPTAKDWQTRLNEFWGRTNQALQEAQRQTAAQVNSQVIWTVDRFLIYTGNNGTMPMFALDDTGVRLGNVLVINTPGRKVYIGAGEYANDNTPFYIDTLGRFSLGANLSWDPDTDTLTVTGIITATSGTIGGFDIGADYIRDTANSFGLASTVTVGDDVRFWAGAAFSARNVAPVRISESGLLYASGATFAGTTTLATVHIHNTVGIGNAPIAWAGLRVGIVLSNTVTYSIYDQVSHSSTANGSISIGYYGNSYINAGAYTGVIFYGAYINNSIINGALAEYYGIYIADGPAATTKYAIYTTAAAGQCVFLGGINSTPIGATTPGTGAFTTLSATGKISSSVASGSFGLQVEAGARISLDGGGNTYIEESSADVISFVAGGTERAALSTTSLKLSSLAGVGSRTVVADANGVLSAP